MDVVCGARTIPAYMRSSRSEAAQCGTASASFVLFVIARLPSVMANHVKLKSK